MPLSDNVSILPSTPEAELVHYIREKDRAPQLAEFAFRELHRRLSWPIYKKLEYLLHDKEDAKDVLQETFIKLWFKPPSNEESIVNWLRKVATNKAYDCFRQKQKHMFDSLPEDEPEEGKPYTPPVSNGPEIEDQVGAEELLEQAINQLSGNTRFVFLLYAQFGFSQADIVATTGIKQNRVSEYICRARERIRGNMEERLQKMYPDLMSKKNKKRRGGLSR